MENQGGQFLVGDPKSSSLLFLSKGGGSDSEVKPGPRCRSSGFDSPN